MYAKILLMTAVLLSGQLYAQTDSTTPAPVKKETSKKKRKKAVPGATTTEVQPTTAAPAVAAAEVKSEEKKPETVKALDLAAAIAPLTLGELHAAQYVKDHFSASYHGEYYFQRRLDAYLSGDKIGMAKGVASDKDIQDFKYMHNPTLIYKPSANWQILGTAEFKYTDAPSQLKGTFVNDYHRALVTVTRKNILTEKENGVGLDAGIGRRDYNTRTTPSAWGNDRVFTTISKTVGKHNGSLFVQYLYNDPKKSNAATWKHGLEVIPTINLQLTNKLSYLFNDDININTPKFKTTPRDVSITHEMNAAYLNYQWTDKINTYYQLKYYHIEDFTNDFQSKDDYFEHYAGVGYAVTPKFTVTAEVGGDLIHAHDGKSLFSTKSSYPELALYLDIAL